MLTVLVWVFYAQFAILTFMWHRKPRIVIDQTEDRSVHTRFVLVNLSEQPAYISCVLMAVRRGKEETIHKIATYHRANSDQEDGQEEELREEQRHGTLAPAQLLMLGSSEENLTWLLQDDDDDVDEPRDRRVSRALREVDEFELRVVAMVGTDDKPVASSRRFEIERTDRGVLILPKDTYTQHFASWRNRRTAIEWAEYCIRN